MKKEKTSTINNMETIKMSELSDREKKIYESGQANGAAYMAMVAIILMMIVCFFAQLFIKP